MSFSEALYKSSCCLVVHAISHYSPDVLKAHAGVALPLAFLGMHQEPEEEKGESAEANLWSEVWQEHVPGRLQYTTFEREKIILQINSLHFECAGSEMHFSIKGQFLPPGIDFQGHFFTFVRAIFITTMTI